MLPTAPLSPSAQRDFLRELIDRTARVRSGPRTPVMVFDLDGTLLDNRPRTAAILREVSTTWQDPYPAAAQALSQVEPGALAYSIHESMARLGVREDQLIAEVQEHWRLRFFTDDYLRHDVPLAGAAGFVQAAYAAGATIVYLTGRDLPNMSIGSWRSLRDHGFPIGVVGTELVCKPAFEMSDEVFKREQAAQMRRLGELIASFDNEPGNCNVFLREYPGAASVLLATQHSPGAPAPEPGVVALRDFEMG